MQRHLVCLACLVLLPASATRIANLRKTAPAPPPVRADSKVVDGPDCGHVKQVISKWSKSAKVGKIAGVAGGAVLKAEGDGGVADRAAVRAREIGEAITGTPAEYPEGIKLAAQTAEDAGKDATKAATDLQTELDLFKGKIEGTDFAGEGVEDADIASLQKLTKAATEAAGKANEAAKEALKKAKDGEKEAMESTASAAKLLKGVIDGTKGAQEGAAKLTQQAKDKAKDVVTLGTKTDGVITEIDGKIATAEEQAPVWTALKEDLTGQKTGVTDADKDLTALVDGDLKTATDTLKTEIKPIQENADKAAGGNAVPDMTEEISKANAALDDTTAAISKVKAKGGTLDDRMKRLESKLEEVEAKLSKTRTLDEAKKNVA